MSAEMHPLEALQELVDDRLSGDARRAVDAHLAGCSSCRERLATLATAKKLVARLPQPSLPAGFEARMLASLDEAAAGASVPNVHAPMPAASASGWGRRATLAAAAVVLGAIVWWSWPSRDVPDLAAEAVAAYEAGDLPMESVSADATALNAYLQARVAFPVRVFDLGMMGYALEGARVMDLDGTPSAAWVYRNEAGKLVCQMYRGSLADLPAPPETREANGFTFYIYHRDGGTQVFWQEGDVVCALASRLPAEDVIQLAIAKAMRP